MNDDAPWLEGELAPPHRVEAQDYYVMRYLKKRNFRLSGKNDRRRPRKWKKQTWPHLWFRNCIPAGLRNG